MNEGEEFDPTAPEEKEVGREMVDQSTGLGSVVAHMYRGEMERTVGWRDRLDSTTNWAVTVVAGVVAYAFSGDVSHAVILVGLVMGTMFCFVEANRFRTYDVWRSRVRSMQENLFANALDPSQGVEHERWRAALSQDFRDPEPKLSYRAALAHRLRRVYLPLLGAVLFAWVVHLLAFEPESSIVESAALPGIPGEIVVAAVLAYFLALVAIALSLPEEGEAETGADADADHGELDHD